MINQCEIGVNLSTSHYIPDVSELLQFVISRTLLIRTVFHGIAACTSNVTESKTLQLSFILFVCKSEALEPKFS